MGCKLGLCPPTAEMDFGTSINQSQAQGVVWKWWREFHDEFVPWVTRGDKHILVHGGDIVDGVHHRSTTQATQDLEAQESIAVAVLQPEVDKAAAFAVVAGTPVHAGESWSSERRIADRLGAVAGSFGHVHMEFNFRLGESALINDMHHVSVTGLHHTAPGGVFREAMEQLITSAKAGSEPPSVILRHHRHRNIEISEPVHNGRTWATAVPGWQLKGPYTWKVGARNHLSHFGALVVRVKHNPWCKNDVEIHHYIRHIEAPQAITIVERVGSE